MKHIYTPKEYLQLEKIQDEFKDIEIESMSFETKTPKNSTIQTILSYSKALEVKKLKSFGNVETILN